MVVLFSMKASVSLHFFVLNLCIRKEFYDLSSQTSKYSSVVLFV